MKNFVLENPTKIIFGKDTICEIGQEVNEIGQTALLVYGKESIKQNGIYDTVIKSLKENNVGVFEHGGVKSNPLLGHIRQGVKKAKDNKIDVIVAVGGGSVIDAAKAIATGAVLEHDVWKIFKGKKGVSSPLPICCVLTLAASGSEMNGGMVVTNEETNQKLGAGNKLLNPKVSILDPTATYSVSPAYTAYGAVDAIAHTLEFYFTSQGNFPVQDRFMEGLIKNIMESAEIALRDPNNYEARANLMWCATMALNGWTSAGLGFVGFPMHMIEHSMSALFDVPHGAGLSTVIPAWMKWRAVQHPEKFAQFSERVFEYCEGSVDERIEIGIMSLKSWFKKIKSPVSLTELNISKDSIPALAENSLVQGKIWRLREYDKDTIEKILHLAT